MDRFIADIEVHNNGIQCNLKSNMDRFIDLLESYQNAYGYNLKSNMDRFIVQDYSSLPAN